MPGKREATPSHLPDLDCACATIRRTARLVTQLYSREMGSAIEPAQFSLLLAIERRPGVSQTPLGRALGLDKTTVSRNFRLLEKNGWIEQAESVDRRKRGYRLTPSGQRVVAATKPGWLRAQANLRDALEPTEWQAALSLFDRVSRVTLTASSETDS